MVWIRPKYVALRRIGGLLLLLTKTGTKKRLRLTSWFVAEQAQCILASLILLLLLLLLLLLIVAEKTATGGEQTTASLGSTTIEHC